MTAKETPYKASTQHIRGGFGEPATHAVSKKEKLSKKTTKKLFSIFLF